jgi:hypothetical protein
MSDLIRKILKEEYNKSKKERWVKFLLDGYLFDHLVYIPNYEYSFISAIGFLDDYGLDTIFNIITEEQMLLFGYIKNEEGEWCNPDTGVHEEGDDDFMLRLTYDYIHWLEEKGEFTPDETDGGWVQTYPDFYVGFKGKNNSAKFQRNMDKGEYEMVSNISKYDIYTWYKKGLGDVTTLSPEDLIKLIRIFEKTVGEEVEKRIRNDREGFISKHKLSNMW